MFKQLSATAAVSLLGAAVLLQNGCKASEAQSSGFLDQADLMTRDSTTPFQKTYWNSKYAKAQFTEVYVAPVNTDYVMSQNVWEKASAANISKEQINQNLQIMADYTRQAFIKAIQEDPQHRFRVVDKVGPQTLILELALTQLVPSKAALQAIGYVTWVPAVVRVGGAAGTGSQDTGKGVVAMEGRARDGATGEVVAMFADREAPHEAIVDLKALSWWAPAKSIIDTWARQLVELAARHPGEVVKDTPTFELLIW